MKVCPFMSRINEIQLCLGKDCQLYNKENNNCNISNYDYSLEQLHDTIIDININIYLIMKKLGIEDKP